MKILTQSALLTCDHLNGVVDIKIEFCQDFVFIEGQPVLRWMDPEFKEIKGCTNAGATIKPCQVTLPVDQGYSKLIFIEERAVCLDTITGLSDGTPPGIVNYRVCDPGQNFVSEEER